jgi:hypothetical protein
MLVKKIHNIIAAQFNYTQVMRWRPIKRSLILSWLAKLCLVNDDYFKGPVNQNVRLMKPFTRLAFVRPYSSMHVTLPWPIPSPPSSDHGIFK